MSQQSLKMVLHTSDLKRLSNMFVYLATNKINGKQYVGQTTKTVAVRWSQHLSSAKAHLDECLFHKAIRKYGEDSFEIETIHKSECLEDLNLKEIEWINKLNTHYLTGIGYNMSSGGKSRSGWKEERSKTKIRINKIKKPVVCVETGQIFDSIKEAASFFNVTSGYMKNVTSGLKNACKSLHFDYLNPSLKTKAEQKRLKKLKNIEKLHSLGRPVIEMFSGKEYPSVKSAAKAAGCAEISMYKHLKRLRSTCKGLIFNYKDQLGE